jgi:hypothetical protein
MTVATYTHVTRELQGEPAMSAQNQIDKARAEARGPVVNPASASKTSLEAGTGDEPPANPPNSSGWIRTTDLTIMSRAL